MNQKNKKENQEVVEVCYFMGGVSNDNPGWKQLQEEFAPLSEQQIQIRDPLDGHYFEQNY